jgi:hypothetical protein
METIEDFENFFGLYREEGFSDTESVLCYKIGDNMTAFITGYFYEESTDKVLVFNREGKNLLALRFTAPNAIDSLIGALEDIKLGFNKNI